MIKGIFRVDEDGKVYGIDEQLDIEPIGYAQCTYKIYEDHASNDLINAIIKLKNAGFTTQEILELDEKLNILGGNNDNH